MNIQVVNLSKGENKMLEHLGLVSEFASKKFGDKEALCFDERSFSFLELHEMIEKFGCIIQWKNSNQRH